MARSLITSRTSTGRAHRSEAFLLAQCMVALHRFYLPPTRMKTLLALALLCLVPSVALRAVEPPPARTNVLIFFADDMRADTIAALGNPIIQTPNLDRLVRSGVSFRRAYMPGGFNSAAGVPSPAMLLSGQNPFHLRRKRFRSEKWP